MEMTREEAIEILEEMMEDYSGYSVSEAETEALDIAIKEMKNPIRKIGVWNLEDGGMYTCSVCGNTEYTGRDKYCRSCGSKMEGTHLNIGDEILVQYKLKSLGNFRVTSISDRGYFIERLG